MKGRDITIVLLLLLLLWAWRLYSHCPSSQHPFPSHHQLAGRVGCSRKIDPWILSTPCFWESIRITAGYLARHQNMQSLTRLWHCQSSYGFILSVFLCTHSSWRFHSLSFFCLKQIAWFSYLSTRRSIVQWDYGSLKTKSLHCSVQNLPSVQSTCSKLSSHSLLQHQSSKRAPQSQATTWRKDLCTLHLVWELMLAYVIRALPI